MQYHQFNPSGYVMRLDPGDDIITTVEQFFRDKDLPSGFVWGIGSVENPTLAHYRLDHKKFSEKQLDGIYEITALQGNISLFDGQPLVHLHVSLSDEQMQAYGGHLVSGQCSATVELLLRGMPEALEKKLASDVGLKVWDLPSSS